MQRRHGTIDQDLVVYGILGASFIGLLAVKGVDLLKGIAEQSQITASAQQAVKNDHIAQRRFSLGCNTGFVMESGVTTLQNGDRALDIKSRAPLPPGAILCDRTGATAVIATDGTVSDIRVSAAIRKRFVEQGFEKDNEQLDRQRQQQEGDRLQEEG